MAGFLPCPRKDSTRMAIRTKIFACAALLLATSVAATPAFSAVSRTTRHRGHARRVAWNPVLKGSRDSMLRQNEEIDRLQLPRIADQEQLEQLKTTQELVEI